VNNAIEEWHRIVRERDVVRWMVCWLTTCLSLAGRHTPTRPPDHGDVSGSSSVVFGNETFRYVREWHATTRPCSSSSSRSTHRSTVST